MGRLSNFLAPTPRNHASGHTATLDERLMNNALYYDRLCWTREKQLGDPDDVLIKAEQRKRELAAEQQRQKQEPQEGK
jgi:hypothetical protein